MEIKAIFTGAQKKNSYEEKNLTFSIKEDNLSKSTVIGSGTLNLSDYVRSKLKNQEVKVAISSTQKGEEFLLRVKLSTSELDEKIKKPQKLTGSGIMDKIKGSTGGSKKNANQAKVSFEIEFLKLENLPKNIEKSTEFKFKWKRGSKKQNSGESGFQSLEEINSKNNKLKIKFSSTMKYKKENEFSTKKLSIHVYQKSDKNQSKLFGKIAVNLANFMSHSTKYENEKLPIKNKSGECGALFFAISPTWTQFDGKRLIETAPKASEAAAAPDKGDKNHENIKLNENQIEIAGKNYKLEEVEDCSVMSELSNDSDDLQTDFNDFNDDEMDSEDVFNENKEMPQASGPLPIDEKECIEIEKALQQTKVKMVKKSPGSQKKTTEPVETKVAAPVVAIPPQKQEEKPQKQEKHEEKISKKDKIKNLFKKGQEEKKEEEKPGPVAAKSQSTTREAVGDSAKASQAENDKRKAAGGTGIPVGAGAGASNQKREEDKNQKIYKDLLELQNSYKQIEILKENIKIFADENEEKNEEIKKLKEGSVTEEERLKMLVDKKKKLLEERKKIRENNETHKKYIEEMKKQNENLEKQNRAFEEKIKKTQDVINAANGQLNTISNETNKLKRENELIEKEIEEKDEKINEVLQQQSKNLQKQNQGSGSEKGVYQVFTDQFEKLKSQKNDDKKEIRETKKKIEAFEKEIFELSEKFGEKQRKINEKNPENEIFYKKSQFIRRVLLFAPREFDLLERVPVNTKQLTNYFTESFADPHIKDKLEFIHGDLFLVLIMVKNAGVDYKSICYWFSVSISLFNSFLNHLKQFDQSSSLKDVHEAGIYLPERKYLPDGSSSEKTLQFTSFPATSEEIPQFENDKIEKEFQLLLEILLYEIFDLVQSKIQDEIELKLEDSFISGANSLFAQKLTFNDPKMSIQLITDVLDRLLKAFLDNFIPPTVIYQSFSQLIFFISASLFNKLLTNKHYCAPRIAFQIKLGISCFLSWLHKLIPSLPFFTNLMLVFFFFFSFFLFFFFSFFFFFSEI